MMTYDGVQYIKMYISLSGVRQFLDVALFKYYLHNLSTNDTTPKMPINLSQNLVQVLVHSV